MDIRRSTPYKMPIFAMEMYRAPRISAFPIPQPYLSFRVISEIRERYWKIADGAHNAVEKIIEYLRLEGLYSHGVES